ncbi:MAG: DUF1127 domain-containing protein [Gammaproteobacteria bacterium]|nr:DUF1127 domain-containing protein [Gammaproteobacteria bacterium]
MTARTALLHRYVARPASVIAALRLAARAVLAWRERAVQRRELAELPEYMLRDIGLTRDQALVEAAKPFWVK